MYDKQEKQVMEALGETLKRLRKPVLDDTVKLAMKEKIKSRLGLSIVESIRRSDAVFSPMADVRARIKENIFDRISKLGQKTFSFADFFFFRKKFIAGILLFFLTFSIFTFLNVDTTIVYATDFTRLSSFEGDVSVERDGKTIDVEEGMRLYEKDRIMTGSNGKATVNFFDDSIGRLSAETEVIIDVLRKQENSLAKSYVEVDLLSGNMWAKVLNLVADQSSFVVQSSDVFVSAKKAAFNVAYDRKSVEVDVYKNVVDVVTPATVETVVSGQKALLDTTRDVRVEKIADEDKDGWVKENLDSDKTYVAEVEEKLLADKSKKSGVDVDDKIVAGNSFKDDAILLLTFDDVKKQKKQLDLAEKKLIAAEVKLNDGALSSDQKKEVENVISSYSDTVVNYANFVEEVRASDYDYAEELKSYLEDKLLLQKKNLSLVLPNSPSYEIKEAVDNLELLVADDLADEIKIKSEQNLAKLSEAEELIDNGDTDLAVQVVDDYKDDVDTVISAIDSIDESDGEDGEELKTKLVDDVESGMKLLDEIAPEDKIISDEESDDSDESVVEGDFGVLLEGDKPLSPLLAP